MAVRIGSREKTTSFFFGQVTIFFQLLGRNILPTDVGF